MQDNFDLKKYLRHGNKLLNENIGGYIDLRPINGLNEAPMGDDVMTIELDMAWDFINPEEDAAAKAAFDQYGIEVKETDGNPGTFEVTGRKQDILAYLKSEFYGMEYVDIATYYPELLEGSDELEEGEPEGDQYDGEYDSEFGPAITSELEKPDQIYADDDSYSNQDRMMDLGGEEIEKGIMFLLDDGFDPEDVLEMCKMFIDAHSQGKKY